MRCTDGQPHCPTAKILHVRIVVSVNICAHFIDCIVRRDEDKYDPQLLRCVGIVSRRGITNRLLPTIISSSRITAKRSWSSS